MQLYFARHAESLNNALEGHPDYYNRRTEDPGLTDRGHQQAECLAAELAGNPDHHAHARTHRLFRNPWNHEGYGLTHVYCSYQRRAVETARAVHQATGMEVIGWSDIHECGGIVRFDPESESFQGSHGATEETLRDWFPELTLEAPVPEGGWWHNRPLESRDESSKRAGRVYRELLERHGGTDDHILLVSHSMFYVHFMGQVLGTGFRQELWFTLNNTGITRLDIGDGTDFEPGMDADRRPLEGLPVRLGYSNRLDHVPVHLLS